MRIYSHTTLRPTRIPPAPSGPKLKRPLQSVRHSRLSSAGQYSVLHAGRLSVRAGANARMQQPVLTAALFGTVLSAALETCQLFVPVCLTSLTDLLGNASGATLGAWLGVPSGVGVD